MYVKSIQLVNIRSYKNETLELGKGINILLGHNNAGKSTIIRSAYLLQADHALGKSDIRRTKDYGRIYMELDEITEDDARLFSNPVHPDIIPKSDKQIIIFSTVTQKEVGNVRFYFDGYLKRVPDELDKFKIFNKDGSNAEFSEFLRFPDQENEGNFIYPYLSKRKTDHFSGQVGLKETYTVDDNFRNLVAKIQKISNPSHPRNAEFNKHCQAILGFTIGTIPGEHNNNLDIGIYVKDAQIISIRSMGDGVMNIVGLIVILLTENNKLLLIEELENDIHPQALKKLLNLIIEKSQNNQIIISTHSNIVLKYLGSTRDCTISYVDWKPNDGEGNPIPTSHVSKLENTPQNRLDVLEKLGYDFFDFDLYSSYLLLEESSAERIIRDFLIPYLVPELAGKLKTIAAKGVDDLRPRVQDFNRLFVFIHTNPMYHSRAWIIADGDEAGKACINDLKQDFKSWPNKHFINLTKSAFEYYYPARFQKKVGAVLAIPDKKKKREQKRKLLNEVIRWATSNRTEAIKEFKVSAKEVIKILQAISNELKLKGD